MLNDMKAQVAAWKSVVYNADATQGTLQALVAATPPMAVQECGPAEAQETSNLTVAMLQDEIILCENPQGG